LVVGEEDGLSVDFPPSGAKSTQSRYTGAKVNSCLASAALPRERPTALQGMPAMHLRRAQPCTSAAHSHAPPPRTAMHLRRAAVPSPPCSRLTQRCRLARIPSRAGLAHHLPTTCPKASAYHTVPRRPKLPHALADICSQPGRRLQLLLILATRCTTTRPRLPALSRQTTTRTRRR